MNILLADGFSAPRWYTEKVLVDFVEVWILSPGLGITGRCALIASYVGIPGQCPSTCFQQYVLLKAVSLSHLWLLLGSGVCVGFCQQGFQQGPQELDLAHSATQRSEKTIQAHKDCFSRMADAATPVAILSSRPGLCSLGNSPSNVPFERAIERTPLRTDTYRLLPQPRRGRLMVARFAMNPRSFDRETYVNRWRTTRSFESLPDYFEWTVTTVSSITVTWQPE